MTIGFTLRAATSASALGLLLATHPAAAQNPADHSSHAAPIASVAAGAALTEGVITRVDARSGKLTIRHGEIANLGMPPMTMVFGLKDPAQAQTLQPGTKVVFRVEDTGGGNLLITHIEAVTQ
ncbi:copper-binding protein [Comamonas jiangduensis]|uniref:Copper-binding protein n=1 Tax=Comamonas jiangduensis TaxID=1194168 RepID=A0ABV4IFH2_9BURK